MNARNDERIEELLVQRVLGDITPEEERELRQLLGENEGKAPGSWELAASELTAAMLAEPEVEEEMPAHLARSVVERGQRAVAGSGADVIDINTRRRSGVIGWAGWAVAAAALVTLVIGPGRVKEIEPPVAVAELRDSLLATGDEVLQLAWSATGDETAVDASGDVVWSDEAQSGVMRIRGLQANNPGEMQYQLWIFDSQRDDRYPVDGGVFDIPAGQDEVLVAIDVALPVGEATLFAVTVEPPGGVVVSSRERIALLAQLSG